MFVEVNNENKFETKVEYKYYALINLGRQKKN